MKTSAQETFQSPQLLEGCRNLAQPVDERRASPNLVQTDRALKEQVGTLAEQPSKTPGSIKIPTSSSMFAVSSTSYRARVPTTMARGRRLFAFPSSPQSVR